MEPILLHQFSMLRISLIRSALTKTALMMVVLIAIAIANISPAVATPAIATSLDNDRTVALVAQQDPPELVLPIERGDSYVLEFGDLYFAVDPKIGARITTFAIDGENILTGPSVNPDNYGSTFWTSPQSDWHWPPIAAIDNQPYTATVDGQTIVMTSAVSSELGVSVTKKFSADLAERAIILNYTINNESDKSVTYAPWEISRVPAEGVVFYPTGEEIYGSGSFKLPAVTEHNDVTWVQYDDQTAPEGQKLYADGSDGWLASLTDRKLFIKSFPDIPPDRQAPGEGEIEIYFNGPDTYAEVEPQGPYSEIMPGASLSWTVKWHLKKLPRWIPAKVGSQKLIRFVERVLR